VSRSIGQLEEKGYWQLIEGEKEKEMVTSDRRLGDGPTTERKLTDSSDSWRKESRAQTEEASLREKRL